MSDATSTPCATCGSCCRAYLVNVCGYDIWRISTQQRLGPQQFLIPHPLAAHGCDGFYLDHESPPLGLALDKRRPFRKDSPCVFLLELGGANARCGIYADRPMACQTYPMSRWSRTVLQRREALCPPDAWSPAQVQHPDWRARLQRQRMHYDLYSEVVARWNARVAAAPESRRFSLTEYLSFLMNVYDRLAALTAEHGEAAMTAVETSWPDVPRFENGIPVPGDAGSDLPWLVYLLAARQVIDRFYPELPPQPLLSRFPARVPVPSRPNEVVG